MDYHPILGITIFIMAIVISFLLGKSAFKKYKNKGIKADLKIIKNNNSTKGKPPKGEITSPDAPWLKE